MLVLGADRAHGLEHPGRTARIDLNVRVVSDAASSRSVTGPLWPTRAVVGRDPRAVQQRGALRVVGVAKAEQGDREVARGRASPGAGSSRDAGPLAEALASCQMASGAVPTPPPTSSARRFSRGGAKPIPNGPASHSPSPSRSSPRRVRARPDGLEHELQAAADTAHDREGARQERALVHAPSPPLGRGQHVELARVGLGALGSSQQRMS